MRKRLGMVVLSLSAMILSYGYSRPAAAAPCTCDEMLTWCIQECGGLWPSAFYCEDEQTCSYTCIHP